MICLLSVLYCILLNEYILYVCIIIDIVEYKRMDVNEMVMIMIKNLKKNSKDGLLESLENYLKNFFLKHYAFRFILHTIIADKILSRSQGQKPAKVLKVHTSGFCIFFEIFFKKCYTF